MLRNTNSRGSVSVNLTTSLTKTLTLNATLALNATLTLTNTTTLVSVNLTTSRAKIVLEEGATIGARDLVECVKSMNYEVSVAISVGLSVD